MRPHRLLLRAVLVLIATARALAGADLPLSADLEPVALSSRGGAPIPVVWRLIWNGGGLLEGRLQLTIRDNAGVLARVRIDDVVVSGSEQRFRAMLPPVGFSNVYQQLSIRAVFETGEQKIDLGEFLLNVPGQWQRQFGMCICAEWDLADPLALRKLAEGLQLEQFHPERDLLNPSLVLRQMNTSVSRFSPDDMPADPLVYCAFNLVVLDAVGFAGMQPRQIETLRHWIDAGGNVCVFAHGDLSGEHVDFLNALARRQDAFLLDLQGRLMTIEDAAEEIILARYGLGRAAILRGTPDDWQDVEPQRGRQIAAWLWHVRRDQRSFFIEDGHWEPSMIRPAVQGEWAPTVGMRGQPLSMQALSPSPLTSGHQLLNRLMPEDIEVVPLSLIGLILFVYVLLIGPADYFFLGWLKQRKLTWVAFPAITVAATLLTVWLSQVYLGTSAARRTVTFVDIGESGTVARTNRFELLFTGRAQEIRTDVSQAILTPLDHQRLGSSAAFDPRYGASPAPRADLLVGPATYAGRMPAWYTVVQEVPQWTPQVNRVFAIAPEVSLPAFDWESLQDRPRSLAQSAAGTDTELRQRLLSTFGPDAGIYLFHERQIHVLRGQARYFPDEHYRYGPKGAATVRPEQGNFLQETSILITGLFSVLSSMPPTAGSGFEDLVLLDPSNPNEWLLVVVVENGDDLTIYRKLYVQN